MAEQNIPEYVHEKEFAFVMKMMVLVGLPKETEEMRQLELLDEHGYASEGWDTSYRIGFSDGPPPPEMLPDLIDAMLEKINDEKSIVPLAVLVEQFPDAEWVNPEVKQVMRVGTSEFEPFPVETLIRIMREGIKRDRIEAGLDPKIQVATAKMHVHTLFAHKERTHNGHLDGTLAAHEAISTPWLLVVQNIAASEGQALPATTQDWQAWLNAWVEGTNAGNPEFQVAVAIVQEDSLVQYLHPTFTNLTVVDQGFEYTRPVAELISEHRTEIENIHG